MLIGNGYVPGHAEQALDLIRTEPAVRALFESRLEPPTPPNGSLVGERGGIPDRSTSNGPFGGRSLEA
jgi:L-erythro-3,5-diaminohexanoate dehydrogenase